MYTCPKCDREFAEPTAKHWCTPTTIDDVFAKAGPEVVLAFDAVLVATAHWEPNYIGAAKRAVVCSKKTAWMIVRPARKWLDLTVFFPEVRRQPFLHKVRPRYTGNSYEHVIRLHSAQEFTEPVVAFLRDAWVLGK